MKESHTHINGGKGLAGLLSSLFFFWGGGGGGGRGGEGGHTIM